MRNPSSVLVLLCIVAAILFILTTLLSGAYHRMHTKIARDWFAMGDQQVHVGAYEQAILDYRNALSFEPRNETYLLKLAQTLVSAGDYPEARGYLLNLWERRPGSGVINLELARLESHTGNISDAARYYENAINGVWDNNPVEQRRAVRLELASLLLAHGEKQNAEADLIALSGDLPATAEAHSRVGELFLRADATPRALAEFKIATKLDPQYAQAFAGAGQSAFLLGDYRAARQYLERATRLAPDNANAAATLRTTDLVLNGDPFQRGLNLKTRLQRMQALGAQALAHLRTCAQTEGLDLSAPRATQPIITSTSPTGSSAAATSASQNANPAETTSASQPANSAPQAQSADANSDLFSVNQKLSNDLKNLNYRAVRNNPDLLDGIASSIAKAENVSAQQCGPLSGPDAALTLILKKNGWAQ